MPRGKGNLGLSSEFASYEITFDLFHLCFCFMTGCGFYAIMLHHVDNKTCCYSPVFRIAKSSEERQSDVERSRTELTETGTNDTSEHDPSPISISIIIIIIIISAHIYSKTGHRAV